MKRKKEQAEDTFTGTSAKPLLTPMDVQQKEFHVSRMGGYKMRDVDEFLDEITTSMSATVEENRRLREHLGSGAMIGAPDLEEVSRQADEIIRRAREEAAQILRDAGTAAPGPMPAGGTGDRAAISAFLLREREFLQSLAALVQGHAENVKTMAKDARAKAETPAPSPGPSNPLTPPPSPPPAAPHEPPVPREAPAPPREPVAPHETPARESATPREPAPPAAPAPAPRETFAPPPAPTHASVPEPVAEVAAPATPDPAPATNVDRPTEAMEEPVRVEEPEPATVGRAEPDEAGEEEGDRSLRELFWGED
jgi:DivIVA domain-containing protein